MYDIMVKFLQKYIFGDLHILIEKKYRLNIKKQRIELATKTGVHFKKAVDGKCKKNYSETSGSHLSVCFPVNM